MKQKQVDGLKLSIWMLLTASLVVFSASGFFWQKEVYMDEERVFWSAIENSLATKGVRRAIDLSTDGTVQTQVTNLSFSPEIASETVASYKVPDGQDVTSRAISFRDAEYAVFETVANAENPQLKSAEGIWTQTGKDDVIAGVLADSLTNGTIVFVGNLPKEKRSALVRLMKDTDLYEIVDFTKTKQYDGREATIYEVLINPEAYNVVLANYFQMIGMKRYADQVSATTNDSTKAAVEIAISPRTRHVVETGYPEVGIAGSHRYSIWGYAKPILEPEGAISAEELEGRLNTTPE